MVRYTIPEILADQLGNEDGKLRARINSQLHDIVRDDQFADDVPPPGMTHFYISSSGKPRLFAAVKELSDTLLPNDAWAIEEISAALQLRDETVFESVVSIVTDLDAPTDAASRAAQSVEDSVYDLKEILMWLEIIDEIAGGDVMRHLSIYQDLGPGKFKIEVVDLWDAFNWSGYNFKNNWTETGALTIQIDDDFSTELQAAQTLANAILEVKAKAWRYDYQTIDYDGTLIESYYAIFNRWAEAMDLAATAAEIGLSLIAEPADWVLTLPHLVEGFEDGEYKQASLQAALMLMPVVSSRLIKLEKGLKISGKFGTVEIPKEVCEAFAAARVAARTAGSAAAQRVVFMQHLAPLIQNGTIDGVFLDKLVDSGLLFVSNSSSRAYLRSVLNVADGASNVAHHDLPIAKEFLRNFLRAGLDPNSKEF
uniref:hypothetical protein n=1 Tax=Verrucomicrobium spinosum TaxID=2736 RepID=UPI000B141625